MENYLKRVGYSRVNTFFSFFSFSLILISTWLIEYNLELEFLEKLLLLILIGWELIYIITSIVIGFKKNRHKKMETEQLIDLYIRKKEKIIGDNFYSNYRRKKVQRYLNDLNPDYEIEKNYSDKQKIIN